MHQKNHAEATLLRQLHSQGLPVPRVDFCCCDALLHSDCIGSGIAGWTGLQKAATTSGEAPFMVMERLEGMVDEWCVEELTVDEKACALPSAHFGNAADYFTRDSNGLVGTTLASSRPSAAFPSLKI